MPDYRQEVQHGRIGRPVLCIVGPTATGKSRLALALSLQLNGEIINADSRQVYRYMDIGTAKPSPEQRTQAPHHLLDILDPDQDFGLAYFLALARDSLREVHERGRLPVVAGGTGQYVWALIEGWQVPEVPPDHAFREDKRREAEEHGRHFVYQQLEAADPQRAAQLDPSNLRRVIRALEVHRQFQLDSQSQALGSQPVDPTFIIGLTMGRQELYQRIDERVDRMLAAGLLAEVQTLAANGYRLGQGPLSSPGYRELGHYLDREITLEEAVRRTKYQTHRLVRRQYTWFKLTDPRIHWLNSTEPDLESRALLLVQNFLQSLPAVVQ